MRVQLFFNEAEGMTQQHFRDECDVNKLMEQYSYSDLVLHATQFKGQYGDFTCIPDYQEACNQILKAEEMFMTLPADIRVQFNNSPGEFLAFAGDEANKAKMQEMGLMPKDIPTNPPVQGGVGDKNNSRSESD